MQLGGRGSAKGWKKSPLEADLLPTSTWGLPV